MIMTGVRAYLRRGLRKHSLSQRITPQYELDWFATNFVMDPQLIWGKPTESSSNSEFPEAPKDGKDETSQPLEQPLLEIDFGNIEHSGTDNFRSLEFSVPYSQRTKAREVIEVRQRLQALTKNWESPATKYAMAVVRAIQHTMTELPRNFEENPFSWQLPVKWQGEDDNIRLSVKYESTNSGQWTTDRSLIEAIISLWMFALETK